VETPNIIDITTAQSISVLGIDNTIGDAALEAQIVAVSKARSPEAVAEDDETAASLEADPEADAVAEDEALCVELALGTFVSVANVNVCVVPCEAMTTIEVPI